MRHVVYLILLATLLTLPVVALGLLAHLQLYAMRHEPKAGGLLAYPIAVACVTFIGATMHLASLILELEASTSGLGFRRAVKNVQRLIAMILLSFWAPAVLLVGLERWIVCEANVEDGREPSPQLCVEWAISLASVLTTMVALFVWGCILNVQTSRDAFISRIWQRRQQQANIAKGIAPPPAIAPAGALRVHLPPAAPLPLAASPAVVQQPTLTIAPNSAAPPTLIDIEAMTGRDNDNPQQMSSNPMTLPASPPPSALPSWVQSSSIIGPSNEQVPGTATDSGVPSASAAPPQAGAHTP